MAQSPFSTVGNLARDCVYLAAGVGVIAVQKAQVARRELAQKLERDRSSESPGES
jgi:hypothetical protein